MFINVTKCATLYPYFWLQVCTALTTLGIHSSLCAHALYRVTLNMFLFCSPVCVCSYMRILTDWRIKTFLVTLTSNYTWSAPAPVNKWKCTSYDVAFVKDEYVFANLVSTGKRILQEKCHCSQKRLHNFRDWLRPQSAKKGWPWALH